MSCQSWRVGISKTERRTLIKKSKSQADLSAGYNSFGENIRDKRLQSQFPVRAKVHTLMYQSVMEACSPSESIVDMGCGDGGLTALLCTKSNSVTGIDISIQNIESAKLRYNGISDVRFDVMDVCSTKFADKSFETAVSHHVLEHLSDFNSGLSEIKRVASSNIYICLPTANSPLSWTLLGRGNYWSHGKFGSIKLVLGFIRTILNFVGGKVGVDEGSYSSLEDVPHIFFFPKRIARKMNCDLWDVVEYYPQVVGFPWREKTVQIGKPGGRGGLGTIFILRRKQE